MIPLSVWVNCNKICPQVDQLCPSVEKSNRISRERGQPQFMPMLTQFCFLACVGCVQVFVKQDGDVYLMFDTSP